MNFSNAHRRKIPIPGLLNIQSKILFLFLDQIFCGKQEDKANDSYQLKLSFVIKYASIFADRFDAPESSIWIAILIFFSIKVLLF